MINKINIIALFIGALVLSTNILGREYPINKSILKKNNNSFQLKSSACAQAQGRKTLAFNNVSALIETGGGLWQDKSAGQAAYEVPKNSEQYLIFSGSLWIGGKDVNGQLKLAALKFGNTGNEFWPGPLSVTPNTGNPAIGRRDYGAATVDAATCSEYDKFHITTRNEIAEFNGWFNTPDSDKASDFPGYTIPASILNWPAHGDLGKFQDFYLAPFYDNDGDGVYNPASGDYPWYDLKKEVDCRNDRQVTLFGDYNMWWVFNDKGDIHTESGGEQIGMEIRGQAFAFATTDEINNMTFYNYELINRSTQTLTDTYFAFYADADIGCALNDYVGCDIQRGLAFTYNQFDDDNTSAGNNCAIAITGIPPAIGIDFFEGPYQDNDGVDNPLTTDVALAIAQGGIPYAGLGIGYGDNIIDNERFGMRKFVYYNNGSGSTGDPNNPSEFYNLMSGNWTDNTPFYFGGTGSINSNSGGVTNIETDYCFYGNTDPYYWATGGVPTPSIVPDGWTEQTDGTGSPHTPADKRMVQSAGPFTLEPGAVNNITVGIIYSKAQTGGAWQSVIDMRKADDKAQALFDNCFRILNGPDAPDVTLQEMDKTIILYLTNSTNSNNYNEQYQEKDPVIEALNYSDYNYVFQGYKVFQVASEEVGVSDINNPALARLVAQCDVEDSVSSIINFEIDPSIGLTVPQLKVEGSNLGIFHSLKVTEDLFAQGDSRLINHKKYYFLAIAYGYNNFLDYDVSTGAGQNKLYFQGRKSSIGAIKSVVGIPHIPTPELGGSVINAEFGDTPELTRVEGRGNGNLIVDLTADSEKEIVNSITPKKVTYARGKSPVEVKVIDPLNVKGGDYELKFLKDGANQLDSAHWVLIRNEVDSIFSETSINFRNEQIIPDWGISVNVQQYFYTALTNSFDVPEFLESTIEFGGTNNWLTGVSDEDGLTSQNWIRSGATNATATTGMDVCLDPAFYNDMHIGSTPLDEDQIFEKMVDGTWAPYILAAVGKCNHAPLTEESWNSRTVNFQDLSDLSSVDIVYTSDRSKWTRVPVLETQDNPSLSWNGTTKKMTVKLKPSVDKYGVPTNDPSNFSGNQDAANFISGLGMSWFPGYAIDVQTGERLNMAFGEDSFLGNDNGNDMIFNPTKRIETNFVDPQNPNSGVVFGGKHYIYVFRNASKNSTDDRIGAYDNGEFMKNKLILSNSSLDKNRVWRGCMYVGIPLLAETAEGLSDANDPYSYIESDVKIRIRVSNNYRQHADAGQYVSNGPGNSENGWYNLYTFNMDELATSTGVASDEDAYKDSLMALINVVPNPYYAYSNYETSRLDNRIKVVNLPDECTVKIYTVSGTLVRTFTKDNSRITSIDWDLTNSAGIPIAGGLYLIHVYVPSIDREIILKWFGVVRPPDLKNF